MKLEVSLLNYEEREYTSKKTGNVSTAKTLQCLTNELDYIEFGYGQFSNEVTKSSFAGINKGDKVTLDISVVGDKYSGNRAKLVITGVS